MDKTILVGPDIEEGKKLLALLDQSDLEIASAFWYYRDESEVYRLAIVTPFFEKHGPRKTYEKIQKVIRNNPDVTISLSEVFPMGPNDPLNKGLRTLLTKGASDVSGERITQSVVDGIYIDDVYLYRVS